MTDRKFMGIEVEGDIVSQGRTPVDQEPIENLYPYFKAAFENGVLAVKWEQYTPYFNDGEPCYFRVGEPQYTSNSGIAEKFLNDEGNWDLTDDDLRELYPDKDESWYENNLYLESYNFQGWGGHPDGLNAINIPVDERRFELALLGAFGDHTTVVVTPDRVVQFYYDHE